MRKVISFRKHKGSYGGLENRNVIVILEDFHSLVPSEFGFNPLMEFIRQILDLNFIYNLSDGSRITFDSLVFCDVTNCVEMK